MSSPPNGNLEGNAVSSGDIRDVSYFFMLVVYSNIWFFISVNFCLSVFQMLPESGFSPGEKCKYCISVFQNFTIMNLIASIVSLGYQEHDDFIQ